MIDPKERREKYIELRKRFPRRIMLSYFEPLFDEIFDELPEEFPATGELFYIRSTRQTGYRCKSCNKIRLIDYKHVTRDIWTPMLENKETICVYCNRNRNALKGQEKLQYLMKGDTEECLEFQKRHREQWLAAGKIGSNTIKRYFDPNDELYNTESAIRTRKLLDKNRGTRGPYSKEKILSLIQESDFKDRKDVADFINRINTLKNYSKEMKAEILNKANECGVNIKRIGSSFTEDEIKKLIENCEMNNYEDFAKIINRTRRLVNFNDDIYNQIVNKAKELNIPTNRREEIYYRPLSLIKFDSLDRDITLEDVDFYLGVPGVWSVWSDDACLDVYQTKDIGSEIYLFLRRIDNLRNPDVNTDSKTWQKKYSSMLDGIDEQFIIKIIAADINLTDDREKIEFQYAHDNKALYWNPALTQFKYIS